MHFHELEELLEKKNKRIKELSIQNESLDRHSSELFAELKMTADQLSEFVHNRENFSEENWEEMQKERDRIEHKLEAELQNIRDPQALKKVYQEKKINPRWLFVK